MDMDELNAFTCGGKIFVTRKLYHFCLSDSELAAIIGHEIAHNELKHINDNISRNKTANSFG
jgi:Zn-dependent protease with chaperone function